VDVFNIHFANQSDGSALPLESKFERHGERPIEVRRICIGR
jgi:hypothetical protein